MQSHNVLPIALALALSACATARPPAQPDCEGALVPINARSGTPVSTAITGGWEPASTGFPFGPFAWGQR